MLNHGTYDIINGDFKTAKEKESLWEISIGLNKVDGLEPSNYSNMKNNVAVNFDYLNSFYNELIGKKKNELLDMKAVHQ